MKALFSVEDLRQKAISTLDQLTEFEKMLELDIPGNFVFDTGLSRLVVETLPELSAARKALRKHFKWKDHIALKFYCNGRIIVTYRPDESIKLPLPFELWVNAPPETFPKELLGGCILQPVESDDYTIVCPIN